MAAEPTHRSTLWYRQYLIDPSIPVPRTTDWRYRQNAIEQGQDTDLQGIISDNI